MIGENFHGMKLRVKIHTVKLGVKNNIHGLKLIRLFRNQSRHENNFASFVYLRCRRLSLSGQKECLIAGYEKSVKAHQRQEEGKFLQMGHNLFSIVSFGSIKICIQLTSRGSRDR